MTALFFEKQADFRTWLEKNHLSKTELLVGFYKVDSKKPSLTWSESVDEALCFGWIDGVRKGIDAESYCIRFTPRRPTSIWSAVNIKKMEDLKQKNLLFPAGIAIYEKRIESKSKIYAYEKAPEVLDAIFEKQFKTKHDAWLFFKSQAPSYQRVVIHWIMTAKQQATKESRFQKLIEASEAQKRV